MPPPIGFKILRIKMDCDWIHLTVLVKMMDKRNVQRNL